MTVHGGPSKAPEERIEIEGARLSYWPEKKMAYRVAQNTRLEHPLVLRQAHLQAA